MCTNCYQLDYLVMYERNYLQTRCYIFFDYTVEPLEDTPETSTSGHLTESQLHIILPLNRTIVFGPNGVHIREVQL